MNFRFIAFAVFTLNLCHLPLAVAEHKYHHHHQHFADMSHAKLVEVAIEQQSDLYWKVLKARCEAAGIAVAVGFLAGYIIAKA